ncbi:MAG: TonB-dependent receptor, partial [Bacteroidales bacterium]|nr:TonB-dependent receptor [Bacteroidales bacterium]
MKHLIVFTFTMATLAIHAQVPTDSLSSAHSDSIAYNTELDEVVVKAQKQLIKNDIDRIGYDVEADEESETQTVMEMLKKVPLVTVDSEENIKVKGSANFRIYRNGHPDPSLTKNAKEILKAMPASTVKRIEVITDPGAREDAEGVNAILNIVMTDSSAMDGLTGSMTATYNTLQHPNANAFITTQIGKTILSIDYGYGGMSKRETENSITAQRKFIQTGNCSTTEGIGTNKGNVHFADINASYDIDSLNLLSASFSGYFYKLNVEGTRHHSITDATGNTLGSYDNRYWMPGYSHHSWNGRA